jgi:ABC-2 type transport system ATP-binding protein
MSAIQAQQLTRHFKVQTRESGLGAAVRSLWHRQYRLVEAVNAVDFEIEPGEIVGFLGPNGAGKTTTLKMLSGLLHPTSGEARVLGCEPWRRETAFLKRIALVMGQKGQLWWDVPAMDSYLINKEIYEVPDDLFQERLGMLSDLLELGPLLGTQVRQLSLGERMKCELAGSLLHGPEILFLDEPTIGMDVTAQKRLREFIKEYNQATGATILLTSHYMGDIQELCRRVLIIDHGRLIYDGALDRIVERYVSHRLLTIVCEREMTVDELDGDGEVVEVEGQRAVLRVLRGEVPRVATRLLGRLPVADITIEEIPIEDVVRRIFQGEAPAQGL